MHRLKYLKPLLVNHKEAETSSDAIEQCKYVEFVNTALPRSCTDSLRTWQFKFNTKSQNNVKFSEVIKDRHRLQKQQTVSFFPK